MSTDNLTQILTGTIDRLSRQESLKELFHQHRDGDPLPSGRALKEIIELARSILFPGFFGNSTINTRTLKYHIGVDIERMHKLLTDQILAGLCFMDNECPQADCPPLYRRPQAEEIAARLIERMPYIRDILATDVEAAYNGDPAAESRSEIIACHYSTGARNCQRILPEFHILSYFSSAHFIFSDFRSLPFHGTRRFHRTVP